MTLKVIYSGGGRPFWVDAAAKLQEELGWQPCYWVGAPALEQQVKQRFPEVIFHNRFHAARGIGAPECEDLKLLPLDQTLLTEMAVHESMVLRMMDRMDPHFSFSCQERRRLYYYYLRYWSTILTYLQPHIFITPASPHYMYDYILYKLCQKIGVKTILFQIIPQLGRILPVEKFEDGSSKVLPAYERILSDSKPVVLPSNFETHLKKLSSPYTQAKPNYLNARLKSQQNRYRRLLLDPFQYKHLFKAVRELLTAKTSILKKPGKKIEDAVIAGPELFFYRYIKAYLGVKRQLKNYYDKLAQSVDLNQPYIYVALHYQPERTTSPDGSWFVDQFLMVDLLSKTVPAGWYIYVKEHPSQFFLTATTGSAFVRSKFFYDDLAALPNVRLVSRETVPFDLIDNAKAVATVTGAVGWEAVARGVPVLIFGYTWYRGCEGVFYTPTKSDCETAISKIEDGCHIDYEKVRKFLRVFEEIGYLGGKEYGFKEQNMSNEQNVAAITQAIQDFYLSNWGKNG